MFTFTSLFSRPSFAVHAVDAATLCRTPIQYYQHGPARLVFTLRKHVPPLYTCTLTLQAYAPPFNEMRNDVSLVISLLTLLASEMEMNPLWAQFLRFLP
jgi:hypothetical protein